MESTRLDQKPPGYYARLFDTRRIVLRPTPYRAGATFDCSDSERAHYGKIEIKGGAFPFEFSILFPATASGVAPRYIATAKCCLEHLGEMDARVRQTLAQDGGCDEYDPNQDVYLAYIHVEHKRVELQYYWDPFNAEYTAKFLCHDDGHWTPDAA